MLTKKYPIAEKVELFPIKEGIDIHSKGFLNQILKDRIVEKGNILTVGEEWKNGSAFEEIFNSLVSCEFKVIETIPIGKVKIDEKTEIKVFNTKINEDNFPINNIIEVKKIPNTKKLSEVKDINQLIKLANLGQIINRYTTKNKKIYFTKEYFIEVKS